MVLVSQLDLDSKVYFVVKGKGVYTVMESQIAEISISREGVHYLTKIGRVIKSSNKTFQKDKKVGPMEFTEKQLDSAIYRDGGWPVFSSKETAKEFLYA